VNAPAGTSAGTSANTATSTSASIELLIDGMTCSSCAARIERKLNRLDGVQATVNYATEKAVVQYDGQQRDPADLIAVVEAAGYGASRPEAAPEQSPSLLPRLVASAILTIPVILLAMVSDFRFDGWGWLSLALATPVVVWAGWPFHRAALLNLAHRAATMDTLVSLGTLAAYAWSAVALVAGTDQPTYFEVAATVTTFLLAGRYLEGRAKRRSGAALRALLDLGAKDVAILRGGVEIRQPVDDLVVDEQFVVRPGEKIAADGIVQEGSSAIDMSLITGESMPVEVGPGDEVTGATVNAGGRLIVRATRVGRDTKLAQIARLVNAAQAGKAPVQRLADRISAIFVPVVLGLAGLTLLLTLATGHDAARSFTAAVAVLIVACPCALGLATPTALLVGTGRGAQLGVLIKGPEVLEATRRVTTILLDKTGTVTSGRMTVHAIHPAVGTAADEVLRVAAALESASEHPVAAAITAAGGPVGGTVGGAVTDAGPGVVDFQAVSGLGVTGTVLDQGRRLDVVIGSGRLIHEKGLALPADLDEALIAAQRLGRTPVVVAWDGDVHGVIVVGDTVKPGSGSAIQHLRALGLRPVLVTGDNAAAAQAIAAQVGIDDVDDVVAQALPGDKLAVVQRLQAAGEVVAMVGDGVNDAAALAAADLGLAMGTGADVALEAADLTLVRADLGAAVDAIRLSRATLRTIKGNLAWAFGYNAVLIPLAAFGQLNPMAAGAAMALSSLLVVANSLRLRRFA
jgi:P-type Cu+ transporter